MALKLRPFDAAEYIDTPAGVAAYIEDALADSDPTEFPRALGVVAHARGMTELAKETGLSSQSLHRGLNTGENPEVATVLKALGVTLSAAPAKDAVGA